MEDTTSSATPVPVVEKRHFRPAEKAGLVALFVLSFAFFLYFTFPFGVLKEAITATINRSSAFNVRIGTLSPNFPLGVDAGDIIITKNGSNKSFRVDKATLEVGVLSLLIGRLRLDISVEDKSKGELYAQLRFPILSLISSNPPMPSYVELNSNKYPVDGAFDFGLSLLDLGTYQQFLGSYLEKLAFKGLLNGKVEMDLDAKQPTNSSGFVDLSLANGSFFLDDPNLKIDQQIFSRFAIKAKIDKGNMKLDPVTGLTSQDLSLSSEGGVEFKPQISTSPVNINLSYKMEGSLHREIGGLLDGFLGATNGEARFQLTGPLAQIKTANL